MAEKDVQEGMPAPDFRLDGTDGRVFHLAEEWASAPVLLLFYPNDFGIVCSLEMREFQGMSALLGAKGIRVVGVSRNSILTHKQWKESMGVSFLLLSDPEGEVCQKYAGLQASGLLKGMPRRAVFLVDRSGVIRYAWVSKAEGMPPPFDEVRERISTLPL